MSVKNHPLAFLDTVLSRISSVCLMASQSSLWVVCPLVSSQMLRILKDLRSPLFSTYTFVAERVLFTSIPNLSFVLSHRTSILDGRMSTWEKASISQLPLPPSNEEKVILCGTSWKRTFFLF